MTESKRLLSLGTVGSTLMLLKPVIEKQNEMLALGTEGLEGPMEYLPGV